MNHLPRPRHLAALARLLRSHPVVGLLGARQVGKPPLARDFARRARGPVTVLDLEDEADVARLADPQLALADARGLVVLDEIQRRPDLFPALRVLVDRPRNAARFLVLGSASPDLLRQSSETLAGRIAFHELRGFAIDEVGPGRAARLWVRGGFPPSFLRGTDEEARDWRRAFVRTFLERDLPALGFSFPAAEMGRLWRMLAHWHGQTWNASAIATSFGVADTTVRRWLGALVGALVVRVLQPWHENLSKRQVRAPKIYVADTGLLHTLLGLSTQDDVVSHPTCGASWESFAVAQVAERLGAEPEECFFWATHAGAELDLLVVRGRTRLGFEVKRTTVPAVTRSMRIAMDDLRLDGLDVIHAGRDTFPLADGIRAVALRRMFDDVKPLR
jgi:predicted AAA+ superfamily ATPase